MSHAHGFDMAQKPAGIVALVARHPHKAVLIAGLILPLAYAPFALLPVFYLSYATAFFCLWQARARQARLFRLGWLFGFGQFFTGLLWIGEAFVVEGGLFLWLLPFALTLLPAGLALFPALAAILWGIALRHVQLSRLAGLVLLCVLLSLAAYARSTVLTGLPWNLPAMGWGSWLYLAQPVSLIGVHGLGLLALCSVALVFHNVRLARLWALVPVLLAVIFSVIRLHIAAPPQPPSQSTKPPQSTKIIIVQPHLAQREKWQADKRAAHIQKTFRLTRLALAYTPDADLIIWPETAIPALIDETDGFGARIRAGLPKRDKPPPYILTGAVRREVTASGAVFFNSAMLWSGDGHLLARADKHHLVPFGEYLPLQNMLEAVGLQQLTRLRGGYTPGPAHARLSAPGLPVMAPLICYEAVFPSLSAGAPRPDMLVNLTNDGWFGTSFGPYQHLAQARLRAIEQGLPLLRSANTGISAGFDAHGRQLGALGLGATGSFALTVPSKIAPPLYARFGDGGFAALVLGLGLLLIARGRRNLLPSKQP